MIRKYLSIFWLVFFSIFALNSYAGAQKIKYVIYMTTDGTRWQDVFEDHSYFKNFWEKYAGHAKIYGIPNSMTTMEVASKAISLPSYQSQMSGAVQPCTTNACGRIGVTTLPETLKEKLQLRKQDVAIFGSWTEIGNAAEHIEGTVYTNTGNVPVYDPVTGVADTVMYDLNLKQAVDAPRVPKVRFDKYTFPQALHYFETYRPTFMWISFNDADEAAHQGDLEGYHKAIQFFDNALDTVFLTLKTLGIEDETMVVVTTDHGRGDGRWWTSHGDQFPASKRTWAFVFNGDMTPVSVVDGMYNYSTLSIRPTVESALGVA